jgi:hypothetical protein
VIVASTWTRPTWSGDRRSLTPALPRGLTVETDTYLAAFAIAGAHRLATFDRDSRRFPELDLETLAQADTRPDTRERLVAARIRGARGTTPGRSGQRAPCRLLPVTRSSRPRGPYNAGDDQAEAVTGRDRDATFHCGPGAGTLPIASSHRRSAGSSTSGSSSTCCSRDGILVVDRDLILRKLSDLEQDIAQVSEYRTTTTEESRENWRTQRIIERTLQMDDLARFRMAALGWR